MKRREVLCTNSQIADCFREVWSVPAETAACTRVDGCRWEVHPWGACSTTCGVGKRWRNLTCANGDRSSCEAKGDMPDESKACSSYDACRWRIGGWSPCSRRCGRGNHTRTVECPTNDS